MQATSLRQLQLLALPLNRPRSSPSPTTAPPRPSTSTEANAQTSQQALPAFLLHAKRVPVGKVELKNEDGSPKKLPPVTRATSWAADNWQKLGQAPEGTWKRKAYVMGDRFMDRIDYEEWALKAIDPALSPKPWQKTKVATDQSGMKGEQVELLYPKSLLEPKALVESLEKQLDHREPHHRKAMWKCLAAAPLTFPFAIVPVVPNFPLFYVLWRAWSHWRAWKASQYLRELLSASQIQIKPAEVLDKIYGDQTAPSGSRQDVLLTVDKVPRICEAFELGEEEAGELRRAILANSIDLTADDDAEPSAAQPSSWPSSERPGAPPTRTNSLRVHSDLRIIRQGTVAKKIIAWEDKAANDAPAQSVAQRLTATRPKTNMTGAISFTPQDPESKKSRQGAPRGHNSGGPWSTGGDFYEPSTSTSTNGPNRAKTSRQRHDYRASAPTYNTVVKDTGTRQRKSHAALSGAPFGQMPQDAAPAARFYASTAQAYSQERSVPRAAKTAAKGKGKARAQDTSDTDELQIVDTGMDEDDIQGFSDEPSGPERKKARLNGDGAKGRQNGRRSSEDPMSLQAVKSADKVVKTMRGKASNAGPSREQKQKAASAAQTADDEFQIVRSTKQSKGSSFDDIEEMSPVYLTFDGATPSAGKMYRVMLTRGKQGPDSLNVSVWRVDAGEIGEFRRQDVFMLEYGWSEDRLDLMLSFTLKDVTPNAKKIIKAVLNEGVAKQADPSAENKLCFHGRKPTRDFLALLRTWNDEPNRIRVVELPARDVSSECAKLVRMHEAAERDSQTKKGAQDRKVASKMKPKQTKEDPSQTRLWFAPTAGPSDESTNRRRSGRPSTSQYASIVQRPPVEVDNTPVDKVVLTYPTGAPGAISLTHGDTKRLAEGEFLNDTLIEWGMKRIVEDVAKRQPEHDGVSADAIHVFSPFFFKRLTQKKKIVGKDGQPIDNYTAVKKWTQRFDLLAKKYIVVPINEHMHWYLAIIVNPAVILAHEGQLEADEDGPEVRVTRQVAAATAVAEARRINSASPAVSPPSVETGRVDGQELPGERVQTETAQQAPDEASQVDAGTSTEGGASPAADESADTDSDKLIVDQLVHDVAPVSTDAKQATAISAEDPSVAVPLEAPVPLKKTATPILPSSRPPDARSSSLDLAAASVVAQDGPERTPLDQKCIILVFDSLGGHHPAVYKRLRDYLIREAWDKKNFVVDRTWAIDQGGIEGVTVNVPLQTNFSDCGVYVLHYVEHFLKVPLMLTEFAINTQRSRKAKDAKANADLEQQVHEVWSGKDAAQKRRLMREEIAKLSAEWLKIQAPIEAQQAKEREEKARKKQPRTEAESARLSEAAVAAAAAAEEAKSQKTLQPAKKRSRRGQKAETETLVLSDDDDEEPGGAPERETAAEPKQTANDETPMNDNNDDDDDDGTSSVPTAGQVPSHRTALPSTSPPPGPSQAPGTPTNGDGEHLDGPAPTQTQGRGTSTSSNASSTSIVNLEQAKKSPSPVPKRARPKSMREMHFRKVANAPSLQDNGSCAPKVPQHIRFDQNGNQRLSVSDGREVDGAHGGSSGRVDATQVMSNQTGDPAQDSLPTFPKYHGGWNVKPLETRETDDGGEVMDLDKDGDEIFTFPDLQPTSLQIRDANAASQASGQSALPAATRSSTGTAALEAIMLD
ncbi:hypothetical protein ACM66B_006715 [Microbotryomycetes sp. NB124-2]